MCKLMQNNIIKASKRFLGKLQVEPQLLFVCAAGTPFCDHIFCLPRIAFKACLCFPLWHTFFYFLSNLERSRFLGAGRNFRTSIGSFRFTSSWDSEVILLSQRLALKYNTIRRARCQHFFASFFFFLQNSSSGRLQPLRCGHGRSVSPCQGETKVLYIIYTL